MAITLPGFTNRSLSNSVWGARGGLGAWLKNNNGMGTDWFGQFGVLPTIGLGLQGLAGLGDIWMGWNNYNLAREAYDFQRALANRNLQNQGKIINDAFDRAGDVNAALVGNVDSNGWYGGVNDNALAASRDLAQRQHVDTSYIG